MRRKRTVTAGLLQLADKSSGHIYIKDNVEGHISIANPSNMSLTFAPGVRVQSTTPATPALTFGSSPWLQTSGSGGTTNTVSSAVTVGSTSLSITTSVTPGWYLLGHRNRFSLSDSPGLQSDGEFVYITTTGTTATLSAPTTKAYDSGSKINRIDETQSVVGQNCNILGGHFIANGSTTEGVGAAQTIAVQTQVGFNGQDIASEGGRVDCFRVFYVQNFNLNNVRIIAFRSPDETATGSGYGLALNACNSGTIRGVSGSGSRHTVGYHRLSHNLTTYGIYGVNVAKLFDIHDGGVNLNAHGIIHPYKTTFSDGIARVSRDYGQVTIGNGSHLNNIVGCQMSGLQVGDVYITHHCENLEIQGTGNTARRLWFIQSNPGTHSVTSQFKTSTINLNRHGLANDPTVDVGETCVNNNTALSTTRFGNNNATTHIASFDRVRVIGSSECYQPSHGIDGRARYAGTWTDYSIRVEGGDVRVKAGLGSGGHPVRFLGFGSTLATVQRIEFNDVDFYHNANITLAVSSDVATTDLTVAVSDSQYSFNGGALAAFNTSTNISTTVTRSGSVTSIVEPNSSYGPWDIPAGDSHTFGPYYVEQDADWQIPVTFTASATGSDFFYELLDGDQIISDTATVSYTASGPDLTFGEANAGVNTAGTYYVRLSCTGGTTSLTNVIPVVTAGVTTD